MSRVCLCECRRRSVTYCLSRTVVLYEHFELRAFDGTIHENVGFCTLGGKSACSDSGFSRFILCLNIFFMERRDNVKCGRGEDDVAESCNMGIFSHVNP